ncbi:ATP-binding protein [Geofilum sp. OHC36d9]|uniref:ATP-binding protein n=1 Tax=Geofilum sp. OHC36d9 TaxID=3458413 RepID=UPI004033C686
MVIVSDIKNISLVEKLIDDLTSRFQLHADVYGKVLLAVVEGVNNAILHGNRGDKSKHVVIDYEVNDSDLVFVIKDEGNGFNYQNLPDPTLPENIERTSGRGVFLMKHLADDLEFNECGNNVKLVFNK